MGQDEISMEAGENDVVVTHRTGDLNQTPKNTDETNTSIEKGEEASKTKDVESETSKGSEAIDILEEEKLRIEAKMKRIQEEYQQKLLLVQQRKEEALWLKAEEERKQKEEEERRRKEEKERKQKEKEKRKQKEEEVRKQREEEERRKTVEDARRRLEEIKRAALERRRVEDERKINHKAYGVAVRLVGDVDSIPFTQVRIPSCTSCGQAYSQTTEFSIPNCQGCSLGEA